MKCSGGSLYYGQVLFEKVYRGNTEIWVLDGKKFHMRRKISDKAVIALEALWSSS